VWPELRDELELKLARLDALVEALRPLLTETRARQPDTVETVALAGFLLLSTRPFVPETEGVVRCRQELGGLIKSYYREAA